MVISPVLRVELRVQRVQNTGFSYARVACKGRQLAGYQGNQSIQSLPSLRADPQGLEPGSRVNAVQFVCRVQVAFVQQDDDLAVFQSRDGRHPVNEERVCFGDGTGGDDHQLVDVGHRRAIELVLPGQDAV